MLAGALVEDAAADLAADEFGLGEELIELQAVTPGGVPLDAGLFGLNEDAQGQLLGSGRRQLVCGQLVGQVHFVVLVAGRGGLEVDDRLHAFQPGHQVDDADEGRIEIGDVQREGPLGGLDIAQLGQFLEQELGQEALSPLVEPLPGLAKGVPQLLVPLLFPEVEEGLDGVLPFLEEGGQGLVDGLPEGEARRGRLGPQSLDVVEAVLLGAEQVAADARVREVGRRLAVLPLDPDESVGIHGATSPRAAAPARH